MIGAMAPRGAWLVASIGAAAAACGAPASPVAVATPPIAAASDDPLPVDDDAPDDDDNDEPQACQQLAVAFDVLGACPDLTEAQRADLAQAEVDALAASSEACLDADCAEDGDRAWRQELACERALEGLDALALPCPRPTQ